MKGNTIAIAAVAIIFAIAGIFLLRGNNPSSTSSTGSNSAAAGSFSNKYKVYKSGVLDEDTDKKRVLFFYANWCTTCRPVDRDLLDNPDKIPEDLVVIRVNYNDTDTENEEDALAEKYNVTYQHTFVQIDASGEQITKWSGGDLEDIITRIK